MQAHASTHAANLAIWAHWSHNSPRRPAPHLQAATEKKSPHQAGCITALRPLPEQNPPLRQAPEILTCTSSSCDNKPPTTNICLDVLGALLVHTRMPHRGLPTEGCHLEQARVKGSDPTEMQYKAGTESSSSSSNSGHLQLQNETQRQEPGFVLAACDPIGSSWMGSVEVSTCTHGYASTLTPTGSRARTLGTLGPVLLHISLPPPAPHLRTRTKKKKKTTRRAGSRHSGSGHTRVLSIVNLGKAPEAAPRC